MNNAIEKLAYSPGEVARVLGLGRTSTYQLLSTGELPAIRVGRRILVPRESVNEFLVRRAAVPTGPAPGQGK